MPIGDNSVDGELVAKTKNDLQTNQKISQLNFDVKDFV
jgi:hypothetical protein